MHVPGGFARWQPCWTRAKGGCGLRDNERMGGGGSHGPLPVLLVGLTVVTTACSYPPSSTRNVTMLSAYGSIWSHEHCRHGCTWATGRW